MGRISRTRQYRGTTRAKGHRHTGWQVQINMGGKIVTWGARIEKAEDAARIYDVMAIYARNVDAKVNFDGRPPMWLTRLDIKEFLRDKGVLPNRYRAKEPSRFLSLGLDTP